MKNKNFKLIITAIFSVLAVFQLVSAQPLSSNWYAKSLDISVGDEIEVNLVVNPEADHPVYTVSNTLKYDPGMLDFVRSDFDPDWFVISSPEEFTTDTGNGIVKRTGGVANGISASKRYVKYILKAKSEGTTQIRIVDGAAYDADNQDIGLQEKSMVLNIKPVAEDSSSTAPVQATQINFDFDVFIKPAIKEGQDYNLSIPLDPKFYTKDHGDVEVVVYNDLRNMVYANKKSFIQGTGSVNFVLPAFILKQGNYFVTIKTNYVNSKQSFQTEKQLGVVAGDLTWVDIHKYEIFCASLLLIFIAFLYHLHSDHIVIRRLMNRATKKR